MPQLRLDERLQLSAELESRNQAYEMSRTKAETEQIFGDPEELVSYIDHILGDGDAGPFARQNLDQLVRRIERDVARDERSRRRAGRRSRPGHRLGLLAAAREPLRTLLAGLGGVLHGGGKPTGSGHGTPAG